MKTGHRARNRFRSTWESLNTYPGSPQEFQAATALPWPGPIKASPNTSCVSRHQAGGADQQLGTTEMQPEQRCLSTTTPPEWCTPAQDAEHLVSYGTLEDDSEQPVEVFVMAERASKDGR